MNETPAQYTPNPLTTALPPALFAKEPMREPRIAEDLAATLFRSKYSVILATCSFSAAMLIWTLTAPPQYHSQVEFFVRNTRPSVEITPYPISNLSQVEPVSDTQIGTEMQFLSSTDLRREVLFVLNPSLESASTREQADAVRQFDRRLKVIPLPKTGLIRVTYDGQSAQEANQALSVLAEKYFTRHLRMHGGANTYAFFKAEADRYRRELDAMRNSLTSYEDASKVSLLPVQKDLAVHRVTEIRAALRSNGSELDESQARLARLTAEQTQAQPRIITQQRTMPSQYAAERLNTLLVELNNRRTSLLSQFRPEDRRITELDAEISQTTAALKSTEAQETTEQTTDINPIRQSFDSEISKVRVGTAALRSREQSLIKQLSESERDLHDLDAASGHYDELQVALKQAEDNFNLYARKAEEARIAEALDTEKIGNVTIADGPSYPVKPDSPFNLARSSGLLLGNLLIVGLFTAAGLRRRVFYTPLEAELLTGFPVLATVPYEKRQLTSGALAPARRSL